MPDEPEVHGLLAMMLLLDARREARFRGEELVLLADQDHALWDAAQIADGRAVLDRALALHGRGPYVVQAAIASLHADEPCDWPQIAALYGELSRLTGSPVVELSRAVAVAEAEGPQAGLDIVDRLDLDDYRYLHSTRGELLRRLGRTDEARDAYRAALALVDDGAERRLLERRLAELDGRCVVERSSDVRQECIERMGHAREIQRVDQGGRGSDLAAAERAEEPPESFLIRAPSPLRLTLERAERVELALRLDDLQHRVRTEGADQLVLQILDAHEEPELLHLRAREVGPEAVPRQTMLEVAAPPPRRRALPRPTSSPRGP